MYFEITSDISKLRRKELDINAIASLCKIVSSEVSDKDLTIIYNDFYYYILR